MAGRPPGGDAVRDPRHIVEPGAPEDRRRHPGAESGSADRDDGVVAGQLVEPVRKRARGDVDAPRNVERLVLVRLTNVDDERRLGRSGVIELVGELVDVQPARRLDIASGIRPGTEAAADVAGDRSLRADAKRLTDGLIPVLRPFEDEDEGPVRVDHPAEPRPERRPERDRAGARNVGNRMVGGWSEVEEEGAGREGGSHLLEAHRPRLRDLPAEERRAGLVRGAHPREVARDRRLAAEEAPRERLDVADLDEGVVAALIADRRARRRGDPDRAERACAMGRVDGDVVLVTEDDLVERVMHRDGVVVGVLLAEEVRPSDGADEQGAAGEQERGILATAEIGDRVRDVLGGVTGGVAGGESERAHIEGIAVADRPVLVAQLRPRPDHVAGSGLRRKVAAARDVVVVKVGLDDMADPDVELAGRGEIHVHIATRVDDGGNAGALVGDERREMPEPFDPELADQHGGKPHAAADGSGHLRRITRLPLARSSDPCGQTRAWQARGPSSGRSRREAPPSEGWSGARVVPPGTASTNVEVIGSAGGDASPIFNRDVSPGPTGRAIIPIVEGPADQRSDEGLDALTFAGRAVRAGAQLLVRTFMLRILTLVGTLVLTRILAPDAYGAFGILAALVTLLSAFGDIGLGASLIQQRHDPSPAELATTWTTQVLIAVAGFALLWVAAPWVVAAFSGLGGDAVTQFRVLAVGLVWSSLRSLPSVMLERHLQYLPIAIGEIAGQTVFYAFGISGALLGHGIWGLCIGAFAQSLTAMVIVHIAWWPRLRPGLNGRILRRQIRFGAAYQSSYALAWARDGAIPVVVGLLAGPAAAGVFTVAIRIASITTAVEDIVARLVLPAVSRVQDNARSVFAGLNEASALTAMILAPAQFWLVVAAPSLVALLLPSTWADAVLPVQLVALAVFIRTPARYIRQAQFATGAARSGLLLAIVAAVGPLIAVAVLAGFDGMRGAAIGVLVGTAAAVSISMMMTPLSKSIDLARVARIAAAAALATAVSVAPVAVIGGIRGLGASALVLGLVFLPIAWHLEAPAIRRVRSLLVTG